ncbi:hypothetical protein OSTOST_19021, partial [Ostertagia ostertagi]
MRGRSFLRRHVRGLLRGKFSPSPSLEDAPEVEGAQFVLFSMTHRLRRRHETTKSFLSQCQFAAYRCVVGLDFPALENFDTDIFASYTGPDGGLTQVGEMRRQPLVRMANLDDEMSLSTDGISLSDETDEDEEDVDQPISAPLGRDKDKNRSEVLLGSCSSLIGPNGHEDTPSSRGAG